MQIRFIRDWTRFYVKGSVAEVGPDAALSPGQFVELQRRGLVEVVEPDGPPTHRTAVATAPAKRKQRKAK